MPLGTACNGRLLQCLAQRESSDRAPAQGSRRRRNSCLLPETRSMAPARRVGAKPAGTDLEREGNMARKKAAPVLTQGSSFR
jgi:hypothetical protein